MPDRRRRPALGVRPGANTRLLLNGVGAGLWVTGGLWLIFHFYLKRSGPWGPEPNELEPWWLRLHGAFAFLALWTAGLVGGLHVVAGWQSGRRRWSGVLLLSWIAFLALSGYLLLYAGDDGPWSLLSPAHWIAGLGLPLAYATHRWLRRRSD